MLKKYLHSLIQTCCALTLAASFLFVIISCKVNENLSTFCSIFSF